MKNRGIIIISLLIIVIAAVYLFIKKSSFFPEKTNMANAGIPVDSSQTWWYKRSVMYNIDVEKYKDADGDGIGDFKGLTQQLSYIDSMGFTLIWLAPFQPTPNLDDGYDVSDFYGVDKHLGTMQDFEAFMQAAKARNIRVIMDLVVNHTSDSCRWFQEAEKDTNSARHNWYVWSKEKPDNYDVGMVFPGVQKEIWSYDSIAKEYYYHRFYKFQPDLNMQNPAVQNEVKSIIKFWLEKGMSGFRMDAVPFVIEVPQTKGDAFPLQFQLINDMRNYMQSLRKDAVILGEANVDPKKNKDYYGDNGGRINMMFNFWVNQHLFYSLTTGEIQSLVSALKDTKDIPQQSQWGQFLRNHDEIDLGRLSKSEREEVYKRMGPDKNMQLYDRGIRRRLAPMLNNAAMEKMAYSLLLSLPSTPVIRYGEEIGMGDNLALNERESIRTPMQWDSSANAGFSTAAVTVKPVIDTGKFTYKNVNVLEEKHDANSLLSFIKHAIEIHKSVPQISYGNWDIVDVKSDNVLCMRYQWQGKTVMILHNFSEAKQTVVLPEKQSYQTILSSSKNTGVSDSDKNNTLDGYGFLWLQDQ